VALGSAPRQAGVVGEVRAGPDRELEAGLQIKERDRAVLELGAHDPFRWESQAVPIEGE
jgi:hypothetical protein